jgi:uncharacterized protein (DUF1015 family)
MATISTLQPYRYNPASIADLGAVIAPPYDVISPQQRARMLEGDPHNVIRLILPEGDGDKRYDNAGQLFRKWVADEVLIAESLPGLYPYAETFKHPVTSQPTTRLGFICAVKLEPFSAGIVLPHERTLTAPKADRLNLMKTTRANLEPIFGIYNDADGVSRERLVTFINTTEPLISAEGNDRTSHRVWQINDRELVDALVADLAEQAIFIVDGHHRYETALNYHEFRQQTDDLPDAAESIMMYLAPTSDSGLLVLPTHRVIHSLDGFDFSGLLQQLGSNFDMEHFNTAEEGIHALRAHETQPSLLLLSEGKHVLVRLKHTSNAGDLLPASLAPALADLDVTLLHNYILEQLLGISRDAQAEQINLRYVKSDEDAIAAATEPDVQLVAVMNATRLDQIEHVARSGTVMPQKSTYFYPKLASGLLFNPLG